MTTKILTVFIGFFLYVTAIAQGVFNYEIKGTIKGLASDTLFLSVMNSGTMAPERISIAANNDQFVYKGKVSQPSIVWAQTTSKRSSNGNFTFFVEKGSIVVAGNNDDLTQTLVTGTKSNDEYAYVNKRMGIYYDQIKILQQKGKGDTSTVAYKKNYRQIAELYDSINVFQNDYVASHPDALASGLLLMLISDKIPVDRLETYYTSLGEPVKQLSILAKMPTKIEGKKRSVIGSAAPDFTMNDVNGKPVTLSAYRGKYVLLDFWASWCVPCRKENPSIKAAYAKFRDKNFEVIAVSVDEKGALWRKAIEQDQLPWIHISDLQQQNKVATLYGVQPIPDNFLIDPSGKIIERGLHGSQLETTIEKFLNSAK